MAQTQITPSNGALPADKPAGGSIPSVPELLGFAAYMLVMGGERPDFATLFTTMGRALSGQPLDDLWEPVITPAAHDQPIIVAPRSGTALDCDVLPATPPNAETDWILVAAAARAAAASF
jgi:hypothetical protein